MDTAMLKKVTLVFVGCIACMAVIGLLTRMGSEKRTAENSSLAPTPVLDEMKEIETPLDEATAETSAFEPASQDISALLSEIELAADGDAGVLDEEASDEAQSIREGQIVIQALGQSYDETSY